MFDVLGCATQASAAGREANFGALDGFLVHFRPSGQQEHADGWRLTWLAGDNHFHVSNRQETPAYMEAADHRVVFLQLRVKAGVGLKEASEFFQLMRLEGSLHFHGDLTFAIALAMASLFGSHQ